MSTKRGLFGLTHCSCACQDSARLSLRLCSCGANTRRGQVTLFVVIAIVVVFTILIYYVWVEPTYYGGSSASLDFESCVLDATREAIVTLSLTGGVHDPAFYYLYLDERLPYYCYTNELYETCVVQQPIIKEYFERELASYLLDSVNTCYESSVRELVDRGYNVTRGRVTLNTTIIPERINLDIYAPTTVAGQQFATYKTSVAVDLYSILLTAASILQYEATYGDSSTSQLSLYEPGLVVDKIRRGDGTKVYIITNPAESIKFQFATKSLVWPAGYDVING